jgi:hypothetical protein
MRTLRKIALALVIIGAVNWGLIGLFQFDLVASLFGGQGVFLSRLVYGLVGLSGLICLSFFFDDEAEVHTERKEGVTATNRATFGTEFANDFDPEYRLERDREMRKDNPNDTDKAP